MASSDDEGETAPRDVSSYKFLNHMGEPVSFSELPIEWNKGKNEKPKEIFLNGSTDNGLRKIYKQVVAWKFDLPKEGPKISVLTKEGHWIKLLKVWKPFGEYVRTILITVQFLHFAKWNPRGSRKALWDHLSQVFSLFEGKPSEDDLSDHISFIAEAVKRDRALAKSKLLVTFLEEKTGKSKTSRKSTFVVEENEVSAYEDVCVLCDNGGDLLCCDGKCLRSFHPTVEDGEESSCASLGLTRADYKALLKGKFYCKNCEYKQHQCFACGELGSSDESSKAEVFRCANKSCGHFYHPPCVAKLLHPKNEGVAKELAKKISGGEHFTCSAHKCYKCEELEVASNPDLQFAVCRRCPRSYHRKCLPSKIVFEKDVDESKCIVQRAWEDLLPNNRILIYCLKHGIDVEISTPARDHIKFPSPLKKKNKTPLLDSSRKRRFSLEEAKRCDSSKKQRVEDKVECNGKTKEPSLSELLQAVKRQRAEGKMEKARKMEQNNTISLDADTKKGILAMIEEASSLITLGQIKEMHKAPSTQAFSSAIENFISGNVDDSIEAVRAVLKQFEGGNSAEDAKALCGADLLAQMIKWKNEMKVYVGPFPYGTHYTSFDRYFTEPNKLKKVVNILHWYAQDGDMIVDFSCGSNEFSCLMDKKLNEAGKSCSFKNYDILQAKNDFNFEKRDWMEVKPDELPEGSRLIMGLKPPFGANAVLANKFIDKALEFKPKLLVLIVPHETQRLDEKECSYDLIWEHDQMFSGKSFYLPDSVDVNGKETEDLNMNPPILSVWSHPDWTPKHKAIAEQHGHLLVSQNNSKSDEMQHDMPISDNPVKDIIYTDNNKQEMTPTTNQNKDQVNGENNQSRRNKRSLVCKSCPSPKVDEDKLLDTHTPNHLKRPSNATAEVDDYQPSDQTGCNRAETNDSRWRPLVFAPGPYIPSPHFTNGWIEE